MKEISEIVSSEELLRKSGNKGALATVVKVQGYAYRRPGARMLFSERGREAGFVSAGCLETDLMERARKVMSSNLPTLISYDTSSTDDLIMGLGLGCNGMVEILLEPLKENMDFKLRFLRGLVDAKQRGAMVTVFREKGFPGLLGRALTVSSDKSTMNDFNNSELAGIALRDVMNVLQTGLSVSKKYELKNAAVEMLIEAILPPLPLVIFGAGPDAQPLIKFAHELGWRTTLVDHRPAFATKENFPLADAVIVSHAEELSIQLKVGLKANLPVKIDSQTVALIMTHNFPTELKLLRLLLPSPARYVGLLGPKNKFDLLSQHLRQEGFEPTKEQLIKLHTPVGLDIGAETPEEIAFSIIAEIKAVIEGREAGFLKNLDGPIHGPNRD
ncbi:MAG: Xanthine dehydrogenase [Bacteroidetes bacterium]|nr:Xanthine dehydrogenase [Bacteroidota bacterium]